MLVAPRLQPPTFGEIEHALRDVDWSRGRSECNNLLAFFHPRTPIQIEALRNWLEQRKSMNGGVLDPVANWIRMVAMSRLAGHSLGYFSGRSMPPNQVVTVASQRRLNVRFGPPPQKDVRSIILAKSKDLLRNAGAIRPLGVQLLTGAAGHLKDVATGSVDLTVTSPPFCNAIDYGATNWLRHWFSGIDTASIGFSHHADVRTWSLMIRRAVIEQARVLRPGGMLALEVGEIRKGRVLLEKLVWAATEDLPFVRLGVMVNEHAFSKTARCWSPTGAGTNSNRIVLLQRL